MNRQEEINKLKSIYPILFGKGVLHILNGQLMYEEFESERLMGDSDYIPFNEAMCMNETTESIFDDAFAYKRAAGHGVTKDEYVQKVLVPLYPLLKKSYKNIVLWFGKDVFCQMNLLTILAYMEKMNFKGSVFLNTFDDKSFNITQIQLKLGRYYNTYQRVLVQLQKPKKSLFPIMDQAIQFQLEMQESNNKVLQFIKEHQKHTDAQLLNILWREFPLLGYGDTQFLALIHRVRQEQQ